jgi:hypothetical protein
MRVALGLKARTGRGVLIALGGGASEVVLIERSQFKTVREGAWAPYHAAQGLEPAAARESVKRGIASSYDLGKIAIREAVRRVTTAGHELCGCAVLVGTGMPPWSTEEILAVHVRMHKAEGELFRDVLLAGARACKLDITTLPEKTALVAAAQALDRTRASLEAEITALGRSAGPPWGKDQKEAAAAALVALYRGKGKR